MKADFTIRNTIRKSYRAFRCSLFQILWFVVVCKVLAAIVVVPLLSGILHMALKAGKRGFVSNREILSFLFSPMGVWAGVLLFVLSIFFIYLEFSVLITLIYHGYRGEKVTVKHAVLHALSRTRDLLSVQTLGFGVYTLVILPLANMGIVSSLLPSLEIPNFVVSSLAETLWGALLLLGFALFVMLAGAMLSYALPAMVLERIPFLKAVAKSRAAMKKTFLKRFVMELVLVVVWVLLLVAMIVIMAVVIDANGFFTPNMTELFTTFGIAWRAVVCLVAIACLWVLQTLFMPMMLAIVTVTYLELDDSLVAMPAKLPATKAAARPGKRFRNAAVAVLAVFLIVFLSNVVHTVRDFFLFSLPNAEPVVMGHRGSLDGVENTLEAIQGAIDAGADYAEIDVQLSRDGVPVVVHDTNLSRLSGRKIFVFDLTAEELAEIPLQQNGHAGRIPTLQQVIRFSGDDIRLNVELKLHGHETDDLLQKVMEVVEAENYSERCVFQSLSYELVRRMKQAHPDCRTGYIVYGNLGAPSFLDILQLDIDFLAVEESFATQKLVIACRKADIPVYVWTVNDEEEMRRFRDMGVNGLITDRPELARSRRD